MASEWVTRILSFVSFLFVLFFSSSTSAREKGLMSMMGEDLIRDRKDRKDRMDGWIVLIRVSWGGVEPVLFFSLLFFSFLPYGSPSRVRSDGIEFAVWTLMVPIPSPERNICSLKIKTRQVQRMID